MIRRKARRNDALPPTFRKPAKHLAPERRTPLAPAAAHPKLSRLRQADSSRGLLYSLTMRREPAAIFKTLPVVALAAVLAGCGPVGDVTSGADFQAAAQLPATSEFDAGAAQDMDGVLIDTSHVSQGYVGASCQAASRLKLLVTMGESTQTYDLPSDGEAFIAPLTFGNGTYVVRVMQNTEANSYVELASTQVDVVLDDEFAPYLRPNGICDYDEESACVAKARELVADATTQGEAVRVICEYICANVAYDEEKAAQLKDASGYIPDPDDTLAAGTGICFDYASLAAAMLRSQGIPTRIVTGYVSPENIYHAWIEIYIDGSWSSVAFDVQARTWSRLDLTFAAAGATKNEDDGRDYTTRYVY